MRTRTWPVSGVILAVVWVFVRGPDFAVDAIAGEFLLGLAVGLPLSFLFRRFYTEHVDLARWARVAPYVILYVLVFFREVLVANVDLAYRAVAPGPPLDPEVIYVPLRVESDLGITTIANSITITPGTVTLDHDADRNGLYVHVVDGRDVDAVVEPIRTWERLALVVFDEDLEPGDGDLDVVVTGGDRGGD